MATFSTKSLHFPGGVPKKPKKPKILDSSGLAFAKTLKSLVFFVFLGTSSGNGNDFHQNLAFSWRGTQKNQKKKTKILDSSGLAFAKTLKSFSFFCFFGYLFKKWQRFPPKACIFLEKYPKNKKKIFSFLSTSSGNSNVFHQKLAFPWRGTQKNQKTKDFGLFRRRLCQDSKIFCFFVFLGTSSGNGNVFHQKLAFSWRGTKKTKKTKDFGLLRPRLRQKKSKILDSSGLAFAKKNQRCWTLQASPSPRL